MLTLMKRIFFLVSLSLALADTTPYLEPLVFQPDARIFLIHNLLTPDECQHIIRRAHPLLERSTVVDGQGGGILDSIRTSSGAFLARRSDEVINKLNNRLALLTQIPVANHEDLQILRYLPGQHYLPHNDWFYTQVEKSEQNGFQRVATVLIYLNSYGDKEDYVGGETIFPNLPEGNHQQNWTDVSACTKGKLAVRPKRGDAVLFYSLNSYGKEMSSSLHGSCDVIFGTKYSAPTWMRQAPFHPSSLATEGPFVCLNKHAACDEWSHAGECIANKHFMSSECALACGYCPPSLALV